MYKRMMQSREVGFTLMEILTVIIIIGVLAAIAIPVFSSQRARAQDSKVRSDVRNIVTAAETYLSDRGNTVATLNLAAITSDVKVSSGVTWDIKGNTTTGGYCIAAFNPAAKTFNTGLNSLTYDSTAGGMAKNTGSCAGVDASGNSNTPAPISAAEIAALAAPTNVVASRNVSAQGSLSWTASSATQVSGYQIQRSTSANGTFTSVGTVSGRNTTTFIDTSVTDGTFYYKVVSMYQTSFAQASTVVTLGPIMPTANTVMSAFQSTAALQSAAKVGNFYSYIFDGNGTTGIDDGGNDMYDGGNYVSVNGNAATYDLSTSEVAVSSRNVWPYTVAFSPTSSANQSITISGNLGADGSGARSNSSFTTTVRGYTVQGATSTVYAASSDPSVGEMVFTVNAPGGSGSVSYSGGGQDNYNDTFTISNSSKNIVFYMLQSRSSGQNIDSSEYQAAATAYVNALVNNGTLIAYQ